MIIVGNIEKRNNTNREIERWINDKQIGNRKGKVERIK